MRRVGETEGNLWHTWTERKTGEDRGALVGQQNKDLGVRLEGKKLKQRGSFVYLGGAVCGDGGMEMDIRRGIQAGASAWRKVEGVMGDGHISRKQKGNVLSSCITSACLYGQENMVMTEKQQKCKFVTITG